MFEASVHPNGEKIKKLRKAKKLTQEELADKAVVSKRSVENAEHGRSVKESTLQSIAQILDVPWKSLVLPHSPGNEPCRNDQRDSPENPAATDTNENPPVAEKLQFFGFGERSAAIDILVGWQKRLKANKVRVTCFTGHTLDPMFIRLLDVGVKKMDVFMGTKQMARRLDSRRQEELFDLWWAPHVSDLYGHIDDGRLTIRYYDCPPSFTGIALDDLVYLINGYIWTPTLNWLNDRAPQDYQAHWESMNIMRRPCIDDYTVNAVDMPSMLVVKGYDGPAGDAFLALSQAFELVWKTLEKDRARPPEPGRKNYKPFEEMTLLQDRCGPTAHRRA